MTKSNMPTYNRQIRNRSTTGGFTLVEMILAIGIFSVVMAMAMGALFNLMDTNRQAQALKSVMNNLNFSVESMTRDIRYGYNYYCNPVETIDDSGDIGEFENGADDDDAVEADYGCKSIAVTFTRADEPVRRIVYYRHYGQIYKWEKVVTDNGQSNDPSYGAVTAPEVTIKDLSFDVEFNYDADSRRQPFVTVDIEGEAQAGVDKMEFDIRSAASQRRVQGHGQPGS